MSSDLSALRQHLESACQQAFTEAVQEVGIEMDVRAPYLTGELVGSKEVTEGGGSPIFSATIAYPVIQAATTDTGAKAHDIFGDPYLSFNVGGKQIVINTDVSGPVNHPGNTGSRWFSDGVEPAYLAQIERQLAASL